MKSKLKAELEEAQAETKRLNAKITAIVADSKRAHETHSEEGLVF